MTQTIKCFKKNNKSYIYNNQISVLFNCRLSSSNGLRLICFNAHILANAINFKDLFAHIFEKLIDFKAFVFALQIFKLFNY